MQVDYFLSLASPWTYLGHQRFVDLCRQYNVQIKMYPVDYSRIFPQTGGLPLPKRAPARQAYRLQELARWRAELNLPLTIEPAFFPVSDQLAANAVVALREHDADAALALAGAVLAAVWEHEQNIADADTIAQLVKQHAGDASDAVLTRVSADASQLRERIDADSETAIAKGVFGAPTYVFEDELFWGQDRLFFLEQRLRAAQG